MSGDILGLTDDSRALSASQLHLLLHPTEEEEDAVLRKSEKVGYTFKHIWPESRDRRHRAPVSGVTLLIARHRIPNIKLNMFRR